MSLPRNGFKVATLQKQLFHCRVLQLIWTFPQFSFVQFFQQSVRPRKLLLWNLGTFVFQVSLFPVSVFPIVGKTPSFQNSWIFPEILIVPICWYFTTRLSNKHKTNKPIVIDKWLSLCECHIVGFIIRLMYVFICWCWHHHLLIMFVLIWVAIAPGSGLGGCSSSIDEAVVEVPAVDFVFQRTFVFLVKWILVMYVFKCSLFHVQCEKPI